jgi:hypothetical protein
MHTQDLHVYTAVVEPSLARATLPTVDIGTHAAAIPNLERMLFVCRADLQHFDSEFMPQNTRISEERLMALECMEICATHANLVDTHLHHIHFGGRRWLYLCQAQSSWCGKHD